MDLDGEDTYHLIQVAENREQRVEKRDKLIKSPNFR